MKTTRRIFLALFILSTLGALTLLVFSASMFSFSAVATQEPGMSLTPSTGEPETAEPAPPTSVEIGFTALIGSVITSVTSLVGFIVTTAITWRKEKREASLADVERRKLEIELEKSKLELDEMKKAVEKKEKG